MNEVEEQKENFKSVKPMKTKEKAWARRRWNKEIKEKVMVTIKKKKKKENQRKRNS